VFGNERGKVIIEDGIDENDDKWNEFTRRRTARKAVKSAVQAIGARTAAIEGV
jgi:hypothetical protein